MEPIVMKPNTRGEFYIEKAEITPEYAKQLLKLNHPDNRKLQLKHVFKIAEDISSGNWINAGGTIKIDEDGALIDGQCRLNAVIESGIPIETFIAWNVPKGAVGVIDTGIRRTVADFLKLNGESSSLALGAVVALQYRWMKRNPVPTTKNGKMSNSMVKKILADNPEIRDSIQFTLQFRRGLRHLVTPSLACFAHLLLSKINRGKADYFIEAMATGGNISTTNPIHVLREKMRYWKYQRTSHRDYEYLALIIIAWNAFIAGKKLKQLRAWNSAASDSFPEPIARVSLVR